MRPAKIVGLAGASALLAVSATSCSGDESRAVDVVEEGCLSIELENGVRVSLVWNTTQAAWNDEDPTLQFLPFGEDNARLDIPIGAVINAGGPSPDSGLASRGTT